MVPSPRQASFFHQINIQVKQNFSRSTSIKLDFEDPHFLKNLIISGKFQRYFIQMATAFKDNHSNQRVHVLSGTPGVGKSTFAVFLAKSLFKKSKQKLSHLIPQQDTSKNFRSTYNKAIKPLNYLPVFLNGDEGDIEDAFYKALKSAFERQNLHPEFQDLSKTYSSNALNIIEHWSTHYPDKHSEMKQLIEKHTPYKKFLQTLKQNQRQAQSLFKDIYQQITGGASMASYQQGQVVKLYQQASLFLKSKGFHGIFIVYDEFGKYLERGVRQPDDFDLHFLQDMAEMCNKGQTSHIHLLLLTHLPISQYAFKLPLQIQKEWAKIEGRFEQISFNSNHESSYSLVSLAFDSKVKDQSKAFWKKLKQLTHQWLEENQPTGNFPDLYQNKKTDQMLGECYPLHPSVFTLLPLLSEKVAQNERTMFSFLTRDEEFSLSWFLKRQIISDTQLNFLGPYQLYCYFKSLITNDVGIGGACHIGLIIDNLLNGLTQSQKCEKDIVCLLGIATLINNRSLIKVTPQSLKTLLFGLHPQKEIAKGIKTLEQNKNILFDKMKNEYILFEGSAIDLKEEIHKVRQNKLTPSGYLNLLRKNMDLNFVVPKKYNFENGIIRFYREHLLSLEDLDEKKIKVDYAKEDGKAFYVIAFTPLDIKKIKQKLQTLSIPSCIFLVNNKPLDIEADLLQLQAIEHIYSKKDILSSSPTVKKELDHYQSLCRKSIQNILRTLRSHQHINASAFYKGQCFNKNISDMMEISNLVSDICQKEYHQYPLFYNEMLNKHKASNPVIQGRIRLMRAFNHCHLERYGIEGGGPELALYKALIKSNAFLIKKNKDDGLSAIVGLKEGSSLFPLFKDFCDLLRQSEQAPVSMMDLIERWRKPPFGLRLPLVPLYMNLFFRMIKSPISFFHNGVFVGKIDEELLKI